MFRMRSGSACCNMGAWNCLAEMRLCSRLNLCVMIPKYMTRQMAEGMAAIRSFVSKHVKDMLLAVIS